MNKKDNSFAWNETIQQLQETFDNLDESQFDNLKFVDSKENKEIIPKPEPKSDLCMDDISEIISLAKAYIDFVWSDKYHEDNNNEHYMFETVIEAIYGKDIWDKINKVT